MSDYCEPSCFKQEERKARKQHKCCECHNEINIGEVYQYSSGVWDSIPDSHKTCLSCAALWDDYVEQTGEPMIFEHLKECISDAFYGDYGVSEFANDHPEIKSNIFKLFNVAT